ncbi:MAG: nitrile hydratase accessory protein [Rhizobiaceae bacterium]
MNAPDLLPQQPHDEDGPVFSEPWEAQAFAMAVSLNRQGVFTWSKWTETIGALIEADKKPDQTGERYYQYWLTALEQLVAENTPISSEQLAERKDAWDKAARATPHGEAIELGRENNP